MSFYNELLSNIKRAKKQGLLTEKFKIFIAGMGKGMQVEGVISEREFIELLKTADVKRDNIAGVSELAGYGDIEDEEDKEGLDFDAD